MRTSGLEARRIKSRPRGTEGLKAENEDNSQGRGMAGAQIWTSTLQKGIDWAPEKPCKGS